MVRERSSVCLQVVIPAKTDFSVGGGAETPVNEQVALAKYSRRRYR